MADMLADLYDEEVEIPTESRPESWELTSVRNTLIKLRQLERDLEQVQRTHAAVEDAYRAREAAIESQLSDIRTILQSILERGPHGDKISFPDVGTIHLTTKGGNLALRSQEEAVSAHGAQFVRRAVDMQAMTAWAREQLKTTGEIVSGFGVQPKYKTLVVKKP